MRRRRPLTTNVVLMPLPEIDDEFWCRFPSTADGELHPRAKALRGLAWLWLQRVVRPSLTLAEATLIAAVFFMTIRRCRSQFTATYRQMQDFIRDDFKRTIGREALRSAVRSLADIGLLVVHEIGQSGLTLSLNLHWKFEDTTAAHTRRHER